MWNVLKPSQRRNERHLGDLHIDHMVLPTYGYAVVMIICTALLLCCVRPYATRRSYRSHGNQDAAVE